MRRATLAVLREREPQALAPKHVIVLSHRGVHERIATSAHLHILYVPNHINRLRVLEVEVVDHSRANGEILNMRAARA